MAAPARAAGLPAPTASTLKPADVDWLAARVRMSEACALERIQAVIDGATLGAEQVQDVRLLEAEKEDEVELSRLLFDVLVVVALESTVEGALATAVAGTVAKAFAGGLAKKAALRREAAAELGATLKRLGHELEGQRARVSQATRKAAWGAKGQKRLAKAEAKRDTLLDKLLDARLESRSASEQWLNYTFYAQSIERAGTSGETATNVVALLKGVNEGRGGPTTIREPTPAETSPGVLILGEVLAWAAAHRLSVRQDHALLEVRLRNPKLTEATLRLVLEALDPSVARDPESPEHLLDAPVEALGAIREGMSLLVEASIWARLHASALARYNAELIRQMASNPMDGLAQGNFRAHSDPADFMGIGRARVDYWGRRFGRTAVANVAAIKYEATTLGGLRLAAIVWLSKLNDAIPEALKQAVVVRREVDRALAGGP